MTVHESIIPVGKTQRRPGLHVERPLTIKKSGKIYRPDEPYNFNSVYHCLSWGLGSIAPRNKIPVDGIYMASNVSCEVHPNIIKYPNSFIDKHGGIMHESLPMKAPTEDKYAKEIKRSFFRLVVGDISIWYSKHNTPNPLGILPDCPISTEDKFA